MKPFKRLTGPRVKQDGSTLHLRPTWPGKLGPALDSATDGQWEPHLQYVIGVWTGNADGEGRPGLTGTSAAAPVLFDIVDMMGSRSMVQRTG